MVPGVVESLKIITWEKSTRVAEYAFEYATLNNRKKVRVEVVLRCVFHNPTQLSAIHKANVVKMSDGLFLKACREVAAKYPDITYEEMIVDNTCMQLASRANQFDVMLCPSASLYVLLVMYSMLCHPQISMETWCPTLWLAWSARQGQCLVPTSARTQQSLSRCGDFATAFWQHVVQHRVHAMWRGTWQARALPTPRRCCLAQL